MKSFPLKAALTVSLSGIIPVVGSVLINLYLSDWKWIGEPFHSVIEALGAFAALTLVIIFMLHKSDKDSSHFLWISCALLGMGILDGFHASVQTVVSFVWLHSMATFIGSVFFVFVWLPVRNVPQTLNNALIGSVIVVFCIFGGLSASFPNILPAMENQGVFTPAAKAINLFGTFFFLLATTRFLIRYRTTEKGNDLFFANLCLLFGMAGLLFSFSSLWSLSWWFWHLLRLLAYLLALGYVFVMYQRKEEKIKQNSLLQSIINSILQESLKSTSLEEQLERSLDMIVSIPWLVSESKGCIYLVEDESEVLVMKVHRGFTDSHQISCARVSFGKCLCGLAASTHKVVFTDRINDHHKNYYHGMFSHGHYSVPIVSEQQIIGVVYLCLREGHRRDKNVEEFLIAISHTLALLIKRKRGEEELHLFKAIIESSQEAISISDPNGHVVYINPSYEKLFGRSLEETRYLNYQDYYVTESIDVLKREMEPALVRGKSWEGELDVFDAKSRRFPLWERVDSIRNIDGSLRYAFNFMHDITESKQAKEALQESEEKFRKISSTAQDAIIMMDDNGNISYWNPAAERIFGYTEKEANRKNLHQLIVPEKFHEKYLKGFTVFKDRGQGAAIGKTFEISAVRKEGREFPVELSLSAVKIKNKWNAIGIVRDITRRKEAEEKIKQDYHIQSTINSILHVSLESISLEAQLNRILGLILSLPWPTLQSKGSIYLVEDIPDLLIMKAHRGFSQSALSTCAKVPFGKCYCGKAASTREVIFADCVDSRHETCYPDMPPHGHYCVPILSGERVWGVICLYVAAGHKRGQREDEFLLTVANTLAGIIERKKAETALGESEERFRNTFRQAAVGIAHVSPLGQFTRINKRFCDIVGYTHDEMLQRTFQDITHPEDIDADLEYVRKMLAKEIENYSMEKRYVCKDRSIVWVNLTVSLVCDTSGEPKYFISVVEDITKRKQTEKSLKESQAQLIQSEKMSALGTMVAGFAHELNNSLMCMLNYIQFCLKDTSSYDEKFIYLQDAERVTKQCVTIVDNLLTFAHMGKEDEGGFQKGSSIICLKQVLRLLSYRIEKERVHVIEHYSDNVPEIWMKINSIQQVFLNIIINALDVLKESKKKEIHIDISSKGRYVKTRIFDSGPGVNLKDMNKIFDPFFTTKPPGQGTGLGLSVCQSIIDMHGGKITCRSRPGQGATFEILLPIEGKNKGGIKNG